MNSREEVKGKGKMMSTKRDMKERETNGNENCYVNKREEEK